MTTAASLSRGLLGYWIPSSGSAPNRSQLSDGRGPYDLTNNNTVGAATGPSNNLRDAAQFATASSRYLSRADSAALSLNASQFTLAAWVLLDTTPATSMAVIGKFDLLGQAEFLLQWNTATGLFSFFVSGDGTALTQVTSSPLSPTTATWYHLIAWYDGGAIFLQVNNGTPNRVAHTAGIFDSTSPLTIGAFGATPAQFWDGRIGHVGAWRRVLTATERGRLYNAGQGYDLTRAA
jgi:hypothetical protein